MTYTDILKELKEVNLQDEFTSQFESFVKPNLLKRLKQTNKIYSTASLLRALLTFFEVDSVYWIYWQKVLLYFMNPIFARDKINLPK